jgi:hypothetical protein
MGNVMFIVMCAAVTAAAVQYTLATRTTAAPARRIPVPIGTKLTLPAEATDSARVPAIVLVLNTQCRYCTESMPFYGRLALLPQAQAGQVRISVAGFEAPEAMRSYLDKHTLPVRTIMPLAQSGFNVTGTPALVLAAADGSVVDSWDGWLNPEQEKDVIRAVEKLVRN